MIYPLNATQLESVMITVQALNDVETSLDAILEGNEVRKVGDGHLLMVESPIRIISDANVFGPPEVFGWIVRGEHGWDFTQTDPAVPQTGQKS